MIAKNQIFKIGLYIRVSTEEQAENPEGSIRNQEMRLRDAVEYKNRQGNFGEIKGIYVDAGISAKNMKRPQLQAMLRDIRGKEIDLVMVTELSRLSRNTRDFIQMWDMMRELGCRFQSLREDFDTTTAAGELVLFQLMNLAQFERRQTAERVEANVAARSARGLYNGGVVPVGYKLIKDKRGYLAIDDVMAETVQVAFTAFLREGCLSHTAKWLNDNGYRLTQHTEGGGRFKRVGHFTVSNLQGIFRNKIYTGVKVYNHRGVKKETRAVWPAIIDDITFHRVGEILDKNKTCLKPYKKGRMPYLFSGIVFCKNCGDHMPGKSATGNAGKVGYYEHSWATKKDSTLSQKLFRCEPHRIPAKKLEPLAWEKVCEFVTNPIFMKKVLEEVRKHHESNPLRRDMERFKAKIFGINSQIEALSERLAELPKSVSAAPIYLQMEKLERIKKEYEESLLELKAGSKNSLDKIVGIDTLDNFMNHYRTMVLNDMPVDQKKQMILKFVKKLRRILTG